MITSWCQGCFSCKHTKSTSDCLGTGLLPPSPGWTGKISLPLVSKSLACRWREGGSQITPDYAMDVATELWWLQGWWAMWGWYWWVTHGARSLEKKKTYIATLYQQALLTIIPQEIHYTFIALSQMKVLINSFWARTTGCLCFMQTCADLPILSPPHTTNRQHNANKSWRWLQLYVASPPVQVGEQSTILLRWATFGSPPAQTHSLILPHLRIGEFINRVP